MLLTNWLGNLTSRILKRPVYRSRERRSLSRRWQAVVNNQIVAAESLEDRTLLTTFTVENLDASGTGSLADAIDQANANAGLDTIVFQVGLAGTINAGTTLHIEDDLIINGDTDGDSGTKEITVTGNDLFRIFTVENANATFSNFAITAGKGNTGYSDLGGGGGILALGNLPDYTLTLQSMEFSENESSWGAAVHAFNTIVNIEDSLFFDNLAAADGVSGDYSAQGGAINITETRDEGVIHTITGSTFFNNQTTESAGLYGGGGAIAYASYGGRLNIYDSVFDSNQTAGPQGGGAILAKIYEGGFGADFGESTDVRIESSLFLNNEVTDQANPTAGGGAISGISSNGMNLRTIIYLSTLMNNSVESTSGTGGAISSTVLNGSPSNTLNVAESTFSSNHAFSGGAIATNATYSTILTSTITLNTASVDETGGIYLSTNPLQPANQLEISGTILDANSGHQIGTDGGMFNLTSSNGYNLINGTVENIPNGFVFQSTDITGTPSNLSALTPNGALVGATGAQSAIQTHVPLPGSEAIDNGGTTALTDQIGTSRPQGTAPDIGAIEFSAPSIVFVNDSFINPVIGQDPDGAGGASIFGYDAYATLQDAIDNVAGGGTVFIQPGTYTGNVNAVGKDVYFLPSTAAAQVVIDGDLNLDFGDTLDFQIAGNAAGAEYDQFVVNGTVSINDSFLKLQDFYNPLEGDQFILMRNDGADSIDGEFFLEGTLTRLTEGYEFTDFLGVTGQSAYLTYKGGDGNDLAIVVEDSTPQVSLPVNGESDHYTLKVVGDHVILSDDVTGDVIYNTPLSALGGPLVIDGEPDQDDTLTIDLTGIDDSTPLQVVFNGGTGGNDALNLTGGDLVTMNYYFDNVSDGRIALNTPMNEFLTYTGLEPITSTVDSENVVLYYGDTSETISITNAGGGMTTVDSTAGEMLTFIDPTDVLLLNAGGGDDIINIDSLAANYSGELRIVGGDDDDILNVNTSLSLSADKYLLLTAEDINLNGGSITTNGYVWQSYYGDVTLGADTVINNTGGEGIYFDFTVNGSHSLDVTSDGFVVFYDDVTINELTVNAGTVAGQLSGSINTGSGDVEMTAGENIAITNITTTGEVRLTAMTGAIADNSADKSSNINADRAVLRAGTKIGGDADNTLETSVNSLAASVANGNIEIVNTGALEIGTVDSLDGVTANNGNVIITTASPLTVNQTISGDSVTLTTVDSAAAGDNLTINADITSTVSDITLNSGDDFTLSALATLTSSTTININVDPSAGDPDTAGSTVDLLGDFSATATTITGGADADTFNITPSMNSPISVVGGNPFMSPGDTLTYLTPTGDTTTFTPIDSDGGTISVTGGSTDVTFDEIENMTMSGASSLIVNGTFNSDTLRITATNHNSGSYQLNDGPVVHFSNITEFTFNGLQGQDLLEINNPTGGVFDPVDGVTYNANTGTIHILGGAATTVEHRMSSSTNGSLFYDGESTATINYNGVGSVFAVNDQVSVTDRILTYNTGDEDFIISDGEFALSTTVDSDGGPSVSFSSPTGSLTINSLVGDDTLTFYDLALDFDADLNINGGTVEFIRDLDFNSGDLNLDVDSVEIAAALSTTGNVNIQATYEIQMLASSFVGSIDAGAGDINLTGGWIQLRSLSTTGNVSLTANTTAIYDSNGSSVNITADQIVLRSVTGSEGLEINANKLAASADSGNLSFVNSGDLIIGTVDGLSGLTASEGLVNVITNGALTVNDAVYAIDAVDLMTGDTSNSGEDLTINADVTSYSAIVTLSAADILTIATGSTVSGGEVQMLIDAGLPGSNDTAGGTANINGTLLGTTLELRGGNHDDTVIIDSNGGTNNDGGTLDAFDFPFTFYGFLGFDSFILDDSGDTTGDIIEIQDLAPGSGLIRGMASPGIDITYDSGVDQVTLATGSGADDITLTPNTVTAFNILGGNPTMAPGDTLTYVTPAGEVALLTPNGPDGGTITIVDDLVGYEDVVFDEIETTLVTENLTIEGTVGDDELIITATSANSGTYQLNGGAIIAFNNLTDLTFNGLDGDDRLVINNPTGGLFNPVDGVIYNGGTGGETNGDTLDIRGGTAGTVEHRFVNHNEGAIHYDDQFNATIVYTGLEPIIDTIEATGREFHYSDSSETITLTDAGGGQSTIDSTAGELVTFVNPTSFLNLFSGGGSDIINIDSLGIVPPAPIAFEIDAGAGNDTINVGSNIAEGPFAITGSLTLKGGEGDDTFNLDSLAADLNLDLGINGQDGANDILNLNSALSTTSTSSVSFNTETINLNAGSITSAGSQYYSGNVVLGANTTIDAGDQLFLEGTVSGAFSLDISAANHLAIFGNITTDGLTAISDGIFNMISTVVIDAGAGDISLTSQTSFAIPSLITTGDVYITSAGNIADQNGSLMNIVANRAVLRAQGAIEDYGQEFETQVNLLAASATGEIFIKNTGAIELGSYDGLLGLSATNGVVSVESSGAISVTEDVTANSIVFDAAIVNLDADLNSSTITGNATNVNVTGSAGGAEIQDAVDLSAAAGTVQIAAGTYTPSSTITVSNALTIQGAQAGVDPRPGTGSLRDETDDTTETIIDGSGSLSRIFLIDADDVTLDGLVITNGTGDLVRSSNPVDNITVQYNIIHNSTGDEGVQLANAGNSTIQYNYIFDIEGDGANFDTASNSSIRFNEMRNIRSTNAAIFVDDSEAITIEGNYLDLGHLNNNDGIKVNDFSGTYNTQTSYIINNTVIDSLQDGITIGRSNVLVSGNDISGSSSNNGVIYVSETVDNVEITNNLIHDNLAAVTGTDTNYAIRIGKNPSDFPTNVIVRDNSIVNNDGLIFFAQNSQANLDALRNWWGTTDASVIAAGIVGVMDGGGNTNGSIDFSTILNSGADTDGVTPGFQLDTSSLSVHDFGSEPAAGSRIQNALDLLDDSGTLFIQGGTYTENVDTTATGTDMSVTLAPGNSPGQVTINGNLTLNADDVLELELNGTTTGTGFDQLIINGTLNLGSASLNLIDGYDPTEGDQFLLLTNDGADPVVGTFAGQAEGYEFKNFLGVIGQSAFLTYLGGDGNDVALIVEDSTPQITLPVNSQSNNYRLELSGSHLILTDADSGEVIYNVPMNALGGPLVIEGEPDEDDTLIVDITGIDENTPLQIIFNGGAGGNDTLAFEGGSLSSMEYYFTNASDGSVQLNGSGTNFLTYTGLEPITSTVNATNVTLNYGADSETITVTDAGGGQTTVNSTSGEVLTFFNPTGTLTINAGAGDDIVNVDSLDAAFSANIIINGEADDDTVNLAHGLNLGSGSTTISSDDININGAVTSTGNLAFNAGDIIAFIGGGGSLNAGTGEIELIAENNVELGSVTTTTEVRITAVSGSIIDSNANEVAGSSITADRAVLRAMLSIGTGGAGDLETDLNVIAANNDMGDLAIDNSGDLDIDTVDGLSGLSVQGSLILTTTGELTVSQAVTGQTISLTTFDASDTGQDLNINANISSTASNLILEAGDDLNIGQGITVEAVNILAIFIDYLSSDLLGATANLNGILTAGTEIQVNGYIQDDTVIIDSNGGTANDGGTVDGIQSHLRLNGFLGNDQLILDDSGDVTGDTILIRNFGLGSGFIDGAGEPGVRFDFDTAASSELTLNTGVGTDDISVELGNGMNNATISSAGGNDNLTILGRAGGDDFLSVSPIDSDEVLITDINTSNQISFDGLAGSLLIDGRGSSSSDHVIVHGTSGADNTIIDTIGGILSTTINPSLISVGVQNIDYLDVRTGSGADQIQVSPHSDIAIDIYGDAPSILPGDVLNYTAPAGETSTLNPIDASSGSITTTGGFANITYDGIETQNELTASPDLTVNGTTADDVLTINATGADSGTYQLNSGPVIAFSGITSFTYNGLDGDDRLVINNPVGGVFDPVDGIIFNGGTSGEIFGDSLEIVGGTATSVEHRFVNENDGSIFFDGEGTATITYTGLEPIIDNIDAVNRIFNFTGAAETITLSDDGDLGDGESMINSTLGESVIFTHPTASLTINTNATGGIDALNIEGLDSTFDADLTIIAKFDDTTTFQTNATDIGSGDLTIDRGSVIFDQNVTTTGNAVIDATGGSIIDGGSSAADALTADTLVLSSSSGIGTAGDALDISVNNLEAITSGTIWINSTNVNPLTIGGIGPMVGVEALFGISLVVTGQLLIDENFQTFGDVLIESADSITMAGATRVRSENGAVEMTASGDILLSRVVAGGTVDVHSSAGAILDSNGADTNVIADGGARLRGNSGVGTGADLLETTLGTIVGESTTGGFFIENTGNLSIGGGTFAGGIQTDGEILVESTGDISVNTTVQTNGSEISLFADNDLIINAAAVVDTTSSADVTLLADSDLSSGGSFTQADGAGLVNAQGGTLYISATDNVLISDLQSAGGTVEIHSFAGDIRDNSVAEDALVSAGQLLLRAETGIGTSTGDEDIDTAVSTLAAIAFNGDIVINNTGALSIGNILPLNGLTASNGNVTVTASSPLTVNSDVTAAGTVTLTATDSAGAGDNLSFSLGVTVESTGADVILNSGDDFLLDLFASVIADTTITINIDPITDGAGATVDLLGNVNATQTTINGGDDSDIFNILPTVDSPITVNGGDPTLPGPGDVLNLDFSGLAAAPALTLGGDPGSGQFSFLAPDTEQAVNYTSIEDVNTNGSGSYHLVLDMFFSGFEDASDDTIDVGLDAGGTNLLIDINGSNFFTGNDADILSFTVLGSADNDTLNINETAGGLPFFATAAPAGIPGSNGAHLNLAAETFLEDEFAPTTYDVNDITIHYDGKNGTDAINVNFITDHNAGYFSDVIDGLGSGNIGASAVGDTDIDLGLSFGNVEGVGFSGAANGGLRVDASSTPATTGLNINDAGGAGDGVSQITGNGGFTALVFEGFNDLQVVSGTGAELIDLIALDSATTLTSVELDADDVFAADDVSNDTIRVRSTPAGVTSVSLLGGLGDDLFQIFDAGSTVDNIFAALDVDGEGGNDTLNIVDSGDVTGDTFEVTSTTVDGISSSAGTDVTFANIDDLNVTGTDGDDTINVNLGLQEDLNTVTINGAGGDDDFNLQNSTPVGVNTVLNGQAGNDEFFFDSNYVLRGFINGGGDIDTIDYTTYSNAVHVQLAGLGSLDGFQGYELNGSILGTGGGGTGFDNINDLVGSANSDTLEGPNLNNYWGITANDEGFIIAERNNLAIGRPTIAGDAIATPPEERLDFTDFQNLIGGTQDDRFDLSDGAGLTGTLDGDTGNDSLDYRDYTTGVTVDLFAGTATNIGGGLVAGTGGGDDDNSIENVFGGDGNDNITGDNDHNILGDGLGSDNLDGGGYLVGSGNGGNDVFLMEPGAGGSADVITDIHGNDTIDFRFASAGIVFDVDIINTPQDVFGGNTVELRQLQPEQPDTNPSFMENVVGSEFDDYIFIDPLSQDGNFPIDGPPVLRSADGRGGYDILDFDAKGQAVIDTGYSLTADGVGTVQYLNFEEVTPFEDNPATIVDNGDLGFSLSGDWPYHPAGTAAITTGVGYEDDIHTVPSESTVHYDEARAFWEFYGLTPGVYRVSVTWPASENPFVIPQMASDAPFTVFDGSRNDIATTAVDLGTFDLNQQIAPDDFQADGALWEDLGTFTINSRTLTVMLTNLANGLITADAVRIERVSAGPEVQLTDVTDAPAPPSILVDGHPGGIDFGTTELLTDLTRTFEITNSGSAALDISNIVIPAGFTTTLTAQSVAAGDTISFEITMDSNSFGDRSGLFSFDTNDVDEATFNLLLHGQVSNVVIIDNGDADFSATPGFELYDSGVNRGSAGFEGDIAGAIPNQPGFIPPPAGTDTATWTFTGLANGFYRVSTTWSALYNRVTDAPYTVTSGGNTFSLDVNQTLIPSSFADNGAAWFDLDTFFEVVDGTLTVTLTNDASSTPRDTFDLANGVIADAVRIEYLPTPDLEVTVDGNVVDDDTGVVDFGTTIPGIPVSKTFTVTNLSADPVDVTGLIEFPPGFSIDPASPFGTDTVPVNIPGGGSVTFTIQFDGGTTGSTFGQISFTTGDADENPYNFTVTGAAGPATVGINDGDFTSTGTWNEHIPGVVGDPEFLYTGVPYVGGSGANTASWEFDVEPGRYQIVGHWYVHPDVSPYGRAAATNAPYTIFSDATPVDTFRVSHQTSSDDFLDDGTWWEYIGDPVEIDSNILRVLLSDDADGIVYADEIRIIRVVDPVIKVEVDGGTVDDGGAVDFEDTITGAPVVKTFTVTNFGERNMALGGINVPTGFSLVSGFGDTNLAPGASTTFTLQMDASVGGSFSGMVSFGGDLAVENPFNFAVSGSAADSMIIDNGDPDYSTSGAAWNEQVWTFGDDTLYFQRDQDVLLGGDLPGVNTATWTFDNLGAGTYQVATHWLNHSGYASNAQITIAGIEGGPITVILDQRFYPQGFSADGSIWQELGNFQVAAGNTLTVTISDDGANGNLAADAMRLELLTPGSTAPEIDVAAGAMALTSGVSSIDLGTAFFGETLSQTFTITNTGTNTLNLGAITLPGSGEYTVSSPLGTTTLFAGQSTTFEISFNSTGAAGVVAGLVEIATNDSDENPFTFNITAEMTDVVLIDNGDVGYSSTGNWTNLLYDPRYFESDAQRLNLGQSGTATWDFTNLTAGTYTVSATWLNDPLRATNAEYNVAGVGPVVVNQQVAPNDFAADGFNWEILTAAVVVAPGGSITVTLSDNGPADGAINADAIRIQRVGPLMAAAGVSSTAAPSITQSDLDSVVDAALSYWETAGLSDAQLELLGSVNFVLTDLPDAMLGGASGTTVLIDVNAAGYGWFVDGTPLDSSEFTLLDGSLLAGSGSDAFGQMDLLTVVMHELGHTLGLEDLDSDGTLMSESLDVSERRLPSADELDDFFSGIAGGDNPLLD